MSEGVEVLEARLKITEVFFSLQGEAAQVGWPTVFIRLTGCPLRCQYCDTPYSFHGGQWRTLADLLDQTKTLLGQAKHVCVTGGEPLAQKNCLPLLTALCEAGYTVSLETSGALDISGVDTRVSRIVDIKTPDSLEESKNRWENMAFLTLHDQIKLVLCSRADYDWAKALLKQHAFPCAVLFSPSQEQLSATDLAEWILQDQLPVRFQVQLHKVLWGNVSGK
jgi:7-carboxy-7-deazaguanine synthase